MNPENIFELIPKDKFDQKPFHKLMEISEEEIQPILPELLSWMADVNWPIAKDIVRVLTRFPNSIVPLIKERLKPSERDEDWKYFIISSLIPQLSKDAQILLDNDISRIITHPTDNEIHAEVWNIAKDYKDHFERI